MEVSTLYLYGSFHGRTYHVYFMEVNNTGSKQYSHESTFTPMVDSLPWE